MTIGKDGPELFLQAMYEADTPIDWQEFDKLMARAVDDRPEHYEFAGILWTVKERRPQNTI